MANKFTNFIFTTEGKDTITQVLAAKKVAANAQLSINTVYTFATKLSTSLVYTQISSLGPKQTKPIGTVTPQDNDTVEMRIQLDNADLTAGYNLQGVAIVGQYNGNSFVLGYINANETTNIPPYDGTQVQTVALDVSFAISDTNIVTINTQTAGMLTVDDYNAMVKLLETRVAPLATDSKVVHLKGNESISDVKRFNETIIGSVDGNAGTADYMNVHTISSDINLDSISSNGNYLSTSKTKTTSGKPNGTSEQYTLVVGGNIQLFNDMSTDALYLRNRIDSKTLTPWKKIVEDVDQTLNAKYNYAQLPTVNGSGVALQSDLAAESNSRSVADRDLKTSIALEAQTRSADDIAFGSSLAAEVAARSTADASATAAMTKEQAARSTADASITANLTTETSARSAADTNLQALYSGLNRNINDEIGVRSAADKLLLGSTADLASQIAKERDNRVFNDNSLASGLVSEAAKRDELFGSMGDTIKATSNTIASVNAGAVHKSGDTMTGNLTAPQVIASDLLTGFHNVIQVPDTTTSIIDLINNDFIKGRGFWKEATFIAYNHVLSDAPTNDVYSIIKLATRGTNRTYVEYSDLSGNVWHTTATTNSLLPWVKQANDARVVHNTGNETVAGDKSFTSPIIGTLKTYEIKDGYDMNGYKTDGTYFLNGAKNIVNYPTNASTWATLVVHAISNTTATQTLIDTNNNIYVRTLGGNPATWGSWTKQTSEADTKAFQDKLIAWETPKVYDIPMTGVFANSTVKGNLLVKGNTLSFNFGGLTGTLDAIPDADNVIGQLPDEVAKPLYTIRGFAINVSQSGAPDVAIRINTGGNITFNPDSPYTPKNANEYWELSATGFTREVLNPLANTTYANALVLGAGIGGQGATFTKD